MTLQRTTPLGFNLHTNFANIEFSSLRSRNSKLHILILIVNSCCWPSTCAASWSNECTIAINISISLKSFIFDIGSSSVTLYGSFRLIGIVQRPSCCERIATTKFNSIDCYWYLNALATCSCCNCSIECSSSRDGNLGIESLDKCSILITRFKTSLPVLFVGREKYTICCCDCNRSCSRIQSQTAKCQFFCCRLANIYFTHICNRWVTRQV